MTTRWRVYATRALPGAGFRSLADQVDLDVWPDRTPPAPAVLVSAAREADGLLCLLTDRIGADLLAACPSLKVISSMSVGVDHVDLEAASARGIPVGNTPGVLTETTADLAFALLLAAARRVAEGDAFVRAGRWLPERVWEPDMMLGRDVHDATLGIVGLGAIGMAVARRASGFGMRVLGWSRTPRELPGVSRVSLSELLSSSDFVSLHVALTPETRHLIDAAALARMKAGAILVNTARGEVVDEVALVEALRGGTLGGAALDVFEEEPLGRAHPLAGLPNVVLTPHIGSASDQTRARMADRAVENLLAGLRGERLPYCANQKIYDDSPGR